MPVDARGEKVGWLVVPFPYLLALALPLVFVVTLTLAALAGGCAGIRGPEATSDNGRYVASVTSVDCGATTSWSTSVRVVDLASAPPFLPPFFRRSSNVLSSNGDPKRFELWWAGPGALEISYRGCARQLEGPRTIQEVQVTYQPDCRP